MDERAKFADADHSVCTQANYANDYAPVNSASFHPTEAGYRQEAEDVFAHAGPVVR